MWCLHAYWWPGPQLRGGLRPPWENFLPLWKMSWTYCIHNHCFCACYRCKIWASLRKLFALPGVQSWLRVCWWLLPCDLCQLCHTAQSFHNHTFQIYHQILIGEINVKCFIVELHMHNDTKLYLRLNRNQNEQGELANSTTFRMK